ncbi:MAG TPA: vWA domain-containing protein [Pyrinomonadaceae bacterium]|jgi:hypothetical protein
MRRLSGLRRLAATCLALLALGVTASSQITEVCPAGGAPSDPDAPPEIYLADNTRFDVNSSPQGGLPVLFVHGHNGADAQDADCNFQKDWQNTLGAGLTSFKQALAQNNGLGIEPYYIRFRDQNRSIDDDARQIGGAVELILRRHDPGYHYPDRPTGVQVVIIAYSKGTISARRYLKSLQAEAAAGAAAPRRPVSEFIAIAPPNHGLGTRLFALTGSLAVRQLYNGYRPHRLFNDNCGQSFGTPEATDYIETLNRLGPEDTHAIEDTLELSEGQVYAGEAPGSRPDINPLTRAPNPPTAGTLYLTLFDELNRDMVGGSVASNDCQGRAVALNLSPDARNIPVAGIAHTGWETILETSLDDLLPPSISIFTEAEKKSVAVHRNTVHTKEVICLALYAAVHHRSPEGHTCEYVDDKPVIEPPRRAAAMLALDFSGSMSSPACPDCPGVTRADRLKEAVELFVRLWSAVGVPGDRIGLTYFRTEVAQPAINGETLPLLGGAADRLVADVRVQTPGQSTAMGGGLQRAVEALGGLDDTPLRRVILFTDGMQNVNPSVQRAGGQLVIDNQPGRPNSNVTPAATPVVLDRSAGIAVDTIGIGAGQAFVGLLQDIAAETGGRSLITTSPDALRRFFVEELINALRGFSPQLVAYRRAAVAAGGSTEAFAVEGGVRKLVLKVSWQRGESLDFSVSKDGRDVTGAGRFIVGEFYKIFVIDLPAGGPLASRGDWGLHIKGKAGTAYETAAIVDGGRLKYDATFGGVRPRAGDPLDLLVRLTADGRPADVGARVTVTLSSPTNAAGDIIAGTRPKELPSREPGMSLAERQLLTLTEDPKRRAALKPRQESLVLRPTDKGEVRAQLRPQVPGVYTASVNIEGEDARLGRFSRTLTATTVVRFAAPDPKATDIFTGECGAGTRRYVRLVLSPRDARGQRLGPGLSSAISLRLSAGRTVGGLQDLGDGSYMLVLAPDGDPSVTLEVAGETLFSGPLSQLTAQSKRW